MTNVSSQSRLDVTVDAVFSPPDGWHSEPRSEELNAKLRSDHARFFPSMPLAEYLSTLADYGSETDYFTDRAADEQL